LTTVDGTKGLAPGFKVNSLAFGFNLLFTTDAGVVMDVVETGDADGAPADPDAVDAFSPATSDGGGSAADTSGIFFSMFGGGCCC
jgi:hypothetical protein